MNPGLPHCKQTLYRLSHQENSATLNNISVYTPQRDATGKEARAVLLKAQSTSRPAGSGGALLREDDILIKDLSAKNGFAGKSFIRVAVRDEADNDALYRALEKIRL